MAQWSVSASADKGGPDGTYVEFDFTQDETSVGVIFCNVDHIPVEQWEALLGSEDSVVDTFDEEDDGGARVRLDARSSMLVFQTSINRQGGGSITVKVPQHLCRAALESLVEALRAPVEAD
jgi:hypothetical protein